MIVAPQFLSSHHSTSSFNHCNHLPPLLHQSSTPNCIALSYSLCCITHVKTIRPNDRSPAIPFQPSLHIIIQSLQSFATATTPKFHAKLHRTVILAVLHHPCKTHPSK